MNRRTEFVTKSTDRAIDDLAAGKPVPEFDLNSYKTPEVTNEKSSSRSSSKSQEVDF